MGALDNFLNIAIPVGVFIFFGFTIYKGMKEPIDKFIAWIKSLIDSQGEDEEQGISDPWSQEIEYH